MKKSTKRKIRNSYLINMVVWAGVFLGFICIVEAELYKHDNVHTYRENIYNSFHSQVFWLWIALILIVTTLIYFFCFRLKKEPVTRYNKQVDKWTSPFSRSSNSIKAAASMLVAAPIIIGLVIILKLYLKYTQLKSEAAFSEARDSIFEHIDVWGYFIGAAGITVGILIAKKVGSDTDEKVKKIRKATKKLKKATLDLVDASRRIIIPFPDLFKTLRTEILDYAVDTPEVKKFYYMNSPSCFGKIHTYNKERLRSFKTRKQRYNKSIPIDDPIDDMEIIEFNKQVDMIRGRILELAEKSKDKLEFKMIVEKITNKEMEEIDKELELYKNEPNEQKGQNKKKEIRDFAYLFIRAENEWQDVKVNDGLIYYEYEASAKHVRKRLEIKKEDIGNSDITDELKKKKSKIESDIKKAFYEYNQKLIDECSKICSDGSIVLSDEEINMQLYLVIGKKISRSLMIFYFDEEDGELVDPLKAQKGNREWKDRILVGIYSDNRHVCLGLEKIYNQEFDRITKKNELLSKSNKNETI